MTVMDMDVMKLCPGLFTGILIFLGILLFFCLLRAILGPTVPDRLVAVNMMGTIVIIIIGILAVKMKEGYLVDICLLYAMISFLSVVVLTKVYTGVYLEHKDKGKRLKEMEKEEQDD